MATSSLLPVLALTLLALGRGPRYQHVVERPLEAAGGLSCSGFLVWDHAEVRSVVLVINGSGTGSSAFVYPTFEDLLGSYPVASRPSC